MSTDLKTAALKTMDPTDIISVELGLINQCVLKCRLCLRTEDVAKQLEKDVALDYDALVIFLDALPNLKQLDLVGSISEPTLHKRIHDIVKYAKNRDISIRLSTNGNTFNTQWWGRFGPLFDEKDIVRFAVDGSTQEIHAKYRVGGKLSKVLGCHKAFKENSKAITVLQNIVFDYNVDDKDNIRKIFMDEGFDICEFTHTGDGDYEGNPSIIIDNILPIGELLDRYKERSGKIKPQPFNKNIKCNSLSNQQLYINHMGCVLPCDDMEETTFTDIENNITLQDNTMQECFDHINSIIKKRFFNKTCERCCGPRERQLKEDYPIIQYNRDGKTAELHKFREIMELADD